MLRSPYYLGLVPFKGMIFDGRHPALISAATFDRVQQVFDSHNTAGEKRRKHNHYLKGSLWCHQCGSRICLTLSTGKRERSTSYAFCLGRHSKRTVCQQRRVVMEAIEARVEAHYRGERRPAGSLDQLLDSEPSGAGDENRTRVLSLGS